MVQRDIEDRPQDGAGRETGRYELKDPGRLRKTSRHLYRVFRLCGFVENERHCANRRVSGVAGATQSAKPLLKPGVWALSECASADRGIRQSCSGRRTTATTRSEQRGCAAC